MAVFFGMPDDDAKALLAQAMREWHPALTKLGVKVQIIMAASDSDTPAVKHGGYAALATVRIVPLKDRLTKQYDAEMLVSRHDWETATEAERLALLDHELQHIDPVKKEIKQRKGYKGPKQYYPARRLGQAEAEAAPAKAISYSSETWDGVPGIPSKVIDLFANLGIRTVADLDAKVAELAKRPGRQNETRYSAMRELGVAHELVGPTGDAFVDWEADKLAAKEEPEPEPTSAKAALKAARAAGKTTFTRATKPAPKKRKGTAK